MASLPAELFEIIVDDIRQDWHNEHNADEPYESICKCDEGHAEDIWESDPSIQTKFEQWCALQDLPSPKDLRKHQQMEGDTQAATCLGELADT